MVSLPVSDLFSSVLSSCLCGCTLPARLTSDGLLDAGTYACWENEWALRLVGVNWLWPFVSCAVGDVHVLLGECLLEGSSVLKMLIFCDGTLLALPCGLATRAESLA